jgi:ubiquinone/menaquinone biosynthesis C-methylase UbiE
MSDEYKYYYENIAPIFGHVRLDRNIEIETTITIIRKFVKREEGNILDIGCGTGRYSLPLKEYGYRVIGIDKHINQLKYAPKSLPLIRASAISLPFKNNFFAACLVILVIHQLNNEDKIKLIKESYRVLKPEGKLIIKTCSFEDLRKRPSNTFFPSGLELNLNRYPDITYLNTALIEAGFSRVGVIPTYSEEFFRKDELLSSIKHKHNTTLALIPTEEFDEGYKKAEIAYANQNEILVPHYHTVVVAEK